ncbi:hypothetical protein [Embleya sp. NPDC005971]|uniref:hypothetical protein n=1 Tax=Embleya sp. NPDC005971 TaxID=3156724 RepID=UPI0033C01025
MADDTGTTGSTEETTPAMGGATATGTQAEQTGGNGGATIPTEVQRALHKANKEAEGLRLKLKEFEDRDKTEAERLAERAATAERSASDAQARLLRYEVAAKKNLPASLAARLQGSTPEEIAADADALVQELARHQQVTAPSFDGGVRTTGPQPTDMNALIRKAAGH